MRKEISMFERRERRSAIPLFWSVILICAFLNVIEGRSAELGPTRYVCAPCGLPCDAKYFDKPGKCPSCGMPLISEEEADSIAAHAAPRIKAAILIFDGVEIIDFAGPYEVFGAADFDVYTVARAKDPVTSAMGLTVVPKYTFDVAPTPDILLGPGGGVGGAQHDAVTLKWIADETARIRHTISVCNGAFILASAGLLDGLSATTTYHNIPRLQAEFPKVHVVDSLRYVDNGKIITTAGLSAGIDGALHIVELMKGKGFAELIALGEEYDWKRDTPFVRAALADRMIPELHLGSQIGTWDLIHSEGGTDHWEEVFQGTSTKSEKELTNILGDAYARAGAWTDETRGNDGSITWKLDGKKGEPWLSEVTVKRIPQHEHQFQVRVAVERADGKNSTHSAGSHQ